MCPGKKAKITPEKGVPGNPRSDFWGRKKMESAERRERRFFFFLRELGDYIGFAGLLFFFLVVFFPRVSGHLKAFFLSSFPLRCCGV